MKIQATDCSLVATDGSDSYKKYQGEERVIYSWDEGIKTVSYNKHQGWKTKKVPSNFLHEGLGELWIAQGN